MEFINRFHHYDSLNGPRMQMKMAKLLNANMIGADLRESDMEGAQMHFANISGTQLAGAKLRFANLSGIIFEQPNLIEFKQFLAEHNLSSPVYSNLAKEIFTDDNLEKLLQSERGSIQQSQSSPYMEFVSMSCTKNLPAGLIELLHSTGYSTVSIRAEQDERCQGSYSSFLRDHFCIDPVTSFGIVKAILWLKQEGTINNDEKIKKEKEAGNLAQALSKIKCNNFTEERLSDHDWRIWKENVEGGLKKHLEELEP